ncbi:MAG: hypothetical protein KGZ58_01455 [Ignavibacteriales bacterium]|nr:hypothetical protein [Ignavibacteriales bacterium]
MTHSEVIQIVASWFKQKNEVELVSRFSPGFPEPDVFIQFKNKKTANIECKPSNAIGREYLTGFGQAISYFTQSDLSYLAIPKDELEKFKHYFWVDNVGLLSVSESSVSEIRKSKSPQITQTRKVEIKRGYAYYRDLQPNEIYNILKRIEDLNNQKEINKTNFHAAILEAISITRRWEKSLKSNLANVSLLLRDLKVVNIYDYSLMENGKELVSLGSQNDWDSYNIKLTKCFLLDGGFIDIVALIQELNDQYFNFTTKDDFKSKLENKILEEKLATQKSNVERDLRDVISILHKLNILSDWVKIDLLGGRYNVKWKNILPFVKFR